MSKKTKASLVEDKAEKAYEEYCNSQNIHCNRFPCWFELSQKTKDEWVAKIKICMGEHHE